MEATAIILEKPKKLSLGTVSLTNPVDTDLVVDILYSGISTGTERLLWSGAMPPFPGMGYPLIPGYESVGRIVDAGPAHKARIGDLVFIPGATCFGDIRGLFGGAASRVVIPASRAIPIAESLGEQGCLIALAATAMHAVTGTDMPDLVIGHGVLGRLIARLIVAAGGSPTVWETSEIRREGATDYRVVHPVEDPDTLYQSIVDVSGDAGLIDTLISRLKPQGVITLAGFYSDRVSFAFPPAFMKEARFRIAAEWKPQDLEAVKGLIDAGSLSLDGLITHRAAYHEAESAYETAFTDPNCLKMILNWDIPHAGKGATGNGLKLGETE